MSLKNDINIKIKECLNDTKNQKTINEIISKMGRVLSKKRMLQNETPIIAFDDRIWIGNYSYANNKEFLEMNEIKAVASCLQLPLSVYLPSIIYQTFELRDGVDERFEETVFRFINFIQAHPHNILVHCFSGRSRSVALLLGYIMHKDRRTYSDALQLLKKTYHIAAPNAFFEQILRKLEVKLIQEPAVEPQSNNQVNLLDGNYHEVVESPKKVEHQFALKVDSQKQINLLEIEENNPSLQVDNLLEQIIPTSNNQNLNNQSSNKAENEMNIFEVESVQQKQQTANSIELLDLHEQVTQKDVQASQIDHVQSINLVNLIPSAEHIQNPTKSQAKPQSINLLEQDIKQEPHAQKEENFADSTDFTQKKVKKPKKKR